MDSVEHTTIIRSNLDAQKKCMSNAYNQYLYLIFHIDSNKITLRWLLPLILLQQLVQALTCSHQICQDPGVYLNLVACRVGENKIIRLC